MVHKYDKIQSSGVNFPEDCIIYVQEKLDGANFRVWFDDSGIRFGTKNTEFPADTKKYGKFQEAVDYVKSLNWEVLKNSITLNKYIFYFEAMHKHTINYDWNITPKAVLIDVFDVVQKDYILGMSLSLMASELGCKIPELLYLGKHKKFTEQDIPKSAYYDGLAEGIVIKTNTDIRDEMGHVIRQKIVRKEFKEENSKTFTGSDKKISESNSLQFIHKYCNTVRIDKILMKLEEVKPLPKESLFKALSSSLVYDIVTENIKELIKLKTIDMQEIKNYCNAQIRLHLEQIKRF